MGKVGILNSYKKFTKQQPYICIIIKQSLCAGFCCKIKNMMINVDITSLGANVNVTLSKADLYKFADEIVTSAINQVRSDLALHPKDVYYTIKQVSDILSVDRTTLYRWEKLNYLLPVKFGGVVRYRKSDIDELFNQREG